MPSAPVFAAETPPLPPEVSYGDEVALMNDLWNIATSTNDTGKTGQVLANYAIGKLAGTNPITAWCYWASQAGMYGANKLNQHQLNKSTFSLTSLTNKGETYENMLMAGEGEKLCFLYYMHWEECYKIKAYTVSGSGGIPELASNTVYNLPGEPFITLVIYKHIFLNTNPIFRTIWIL